METDQNESGNYGVDKLHRAKYPAWKLKVKMLLTREGLWGAVGGDETDETKSMKTLAIIGLSVRDAQILHIQECTTGKTAWYRLLALCENAGVDNKIQLMEELMTSKICMSERFICIFRRCVLLPESYKVLELLFLKSTAR